MSVSTCAVFANHLEWGPAVCSIRQTPCLCSLAIHLLNTSVVPTAAGQSFWAWTFSSVRFWTRLDVDFSRCSLHLLASPMLSMNSVVAAQGRAFAGRLNRLLFCLLLLCWKRKRFQVANYSRAKLLDTLFSLLAVSVLGTKIESAAAGQSISVWTRLDVELKSCVLFLAAAVTTKVPIHTRTYTNTGNTHIPSTHHNTHHCHWKLYRITINPLNPLNPYFLPISLEAFPNLHL